jgi:HSP20 family molecular chaperone IbpA
MDVVETTEGIEILLDVPGVRLDDVSVTFSRGAVVVSGRKMSGVCEHGDAAFHLAERGFGHFARAVRLNGAFNAARATASLAGGELRIVIPRVEERRGQDISIRVTAG